MSDSQGGVGLPYKLNSPAYYHHKTYSGRSITLVQRSIESTVESEKKGDDRKLVLLYCFIRFFVCLFVLSFKILFKDLFIRFNFNV